MPELQYRRRPSPPQPRRMSARDEARLQQMRDPNGSAAPKVRSMAMAAECRCPQDCIRDHEHE